MENNVKWITAPSYRDYETIGTPFIKDGKMYSKVKRACDRCCKGVYVCRVENGQPVPHPAYGGVCLKCGGSGYLVKEVRLYTEAEAAKMEAANERAREKREAERRAKMEVEYEQKRLKWLDTNGFTKEGKTFIITGESYSIKDELKENNYIYSPILKWHKSTKDEKYADRLIEIDVNDYFTFSAWGEGWFIAEKKEELAKLIANKSDSPTINSKWLNYEVGEKFDKIPVVFISLKYFDGKFGQSQIVTFQEEGTTNLIKWFTTVKIPYEAGDHLYLSGTIKEKINDKYEDNTEVTVVTRCKMKGGN